MRDEEKREQRRKRALAHPLRQKILAALEGGRQLPATALCHELPGGPSLSTVVYHLTVLADAGLVAPVGDALPRTYALA